MKNKKNLIIGIISAVSIIVVISTVLLLNNKGGSYDKPYIPKGFEHTEGTVDEGYVIKHIATGNEFVWVPVNGDTVVFKKYGGNDDSWYLEESDDGLEESVKKYGGFYIARYEAGCEEQNKRERGASQDVEALSKPNLNVYNRISKTNAMARAKEMATKQGFEGVKTRLMSVTTREIIMKWLSTRGIDVKGYHKEYGNFGTSLKETGSNTEWRQCNIYDLAGNASEWLTDIYKGGYTNEKYFLPLVHGGLSKYGGLSPMGSEPNTTGADDTGGDDLGFRVVLYK